MDTLTFRNPRIVALALLVIITAGLSSLLAIGRQEDPTITNIFATITTQFPGADPARVEALVTAEVEDELRKVPEVDEIQSVSATGISTVSIELQETLPNDRIEQVWSEIRDAVADAAQRFPAGALEPEFDSDNSGAYSSIVVLSPSHDSVPMTIVARYSEEVADEFRNLPGTKLVETFGAPEEEVLVSIDAAKAAALGLTADQISTAIQAADSKVQAGRLRGSVSDLVINVEGEITALERLRRIVLRQDPDGRVTLLGDVADVSRGARVPQTEYALHDGKPAIVIAAKIEDGLQIDAWMVQVYEVMQEINAAFPTSLTAELVFDQSGYTADRLAEVGRNMAIGVALVVAVLFITLGVRSALIVAAVLPVVSLATLATMNMIGLPIHQMSVTGLIVALGLLVDAAIVMVDEIGQKLGKGATRREAVGQSVRRLFAPLLASTITTALSFTPMILLPGPAGDFVGAIAIAVVLMLGWSFLIAVTITPAIAGWVLPNHRGGSFLSTGIRGGFLGRAFSASLGWAMRNPLKSVMLALVLPVIGFASFPTLTAQFFPGVDRDQFHIEVELADGSSLGETRRVAEEIDEVLRAEGNIRDVTWVAGRSAPAFYYNIVGSREQALGFAQALVTTASPDATAALVPALQEKLNGAFPQARILVRGLVQGPPVNAPVEFRIVGTDVDTLRELGEGVRRTLADLDMVTVVRTAASGGAPKVSIDIDEAKAQLLGLDLGGVARQLEASLEGVTGGSLVEGTEELPVRVRLGDHIRGDLAAISDLTVLPAGASSIAAEGRFPGLPLSAIATVSLAPSESVISRRNAERVNTVQAFLVPGVLPEEALKAARTELDAQGFSLPPGYRLEFGGDSDARSTTLNNLLASVGLIVVLSIATVVLTFNSFRLTAVTFVVAGLSAGLSLLALAVFQYPFGITAVIGVIGSIGVSVNAAIIILTGLQANENARTGDAAAMVSVVMGSSRHIVSTTLTTFGGFLPLIVGGGGFWPPFAMAVAGGVLLSTVVSFYFTPPMFKLVYSRRPKHKASSRSETNEAMPPPLRIAAE